MTGFEAIRKIYGFTYEELAEMLGVSKQIVYMWESGKKKIPELRMDELSWILYFPKNIFNIENVSDEDILLIMKCKMTKLKNEIEQLEEKINNK